MIDEITGKIVRILSDHEVVINRGLVDGVKYNTEFVIYEEGDAVVDPKTRQVLDRIEIVKGRVYVTHLQSRICIAETVPSGFTLPRTGKKGEQGISSLNPPGVNDMVQPKLRIAEGEIKPKREVSLEIHVGEKVRNVER